MHKINEWAKEVYNLWEVGEVDEEIIRECEKILEDIRTDEIKVDLETEGLLLEVCDKYTK
ncbi:hypothetical protein [Clostridium sp. LIBA-8841]|uniref:hypothetical protein n=1 Tax=Clostridium sp. LIBA-8841 TaxID=2987530 RepID=UPI002AC7ADEC|nr:hypothetical protein [Clostridium sp. LIBA-8841]MDZ5252303.1 hypothetical protein [Clostridium sp. LIBA-8841]